MKTQDVIKPPCWDFVTWWNGGTCPPAWNGPWLLIGGLRVTKLGPWLCAWPIGVCAGLGSRTKVLFPWVQTAHSSLLNRPTLGLSVVLWCY